MTVSTTYDYNPRRDEIIRLALIKAGLLHGQQTPSADQLGVGAALLKLFLAKLQNEGVILNALERYVIPLTAGTAMVTMPADTLTVEKVATVHSSGGADYQLDCVGNVETYQTIVDKGLLGRPTMYYAEKGPTSAWNVYLWPVPTAEYASATFLRTRRLRDIETGDVNLDLPVKFLPAAVGHLAAQLASHYRRGEQAVMRLTSEAESDRAVALGTETVAGNTLFIVEPLCGGDY